MSIPATLTAGDSLSLYIPSQGYPAADGWSITLLLVPAVSTGTRYTASTSAADPDDASAHLLSVATTATALWVAGEYSWVLQASKAAERVTIATGRTTVRPDPAAVSTAAMDLRSTARQALDAVNAYLANPANLASASYSIAGRSLNRHSMADLLALRSRLQVEVSREEAADRASAGLPDKRRIYVRFGA